MWDYTFCTIFWIVFIFGIYAMGNVLIPEKEAQSVKFVAGYLVYSFWVAIGGIFIQLLNIKWNIFAIYMCILIIGMIAIIIYRKRKHGVIFTTSLKEYLQYNWFIYALCAILCFMLLFYFRSFWYGNHLDDGYYITKVATIPIDGGNYVNNVSVGTGKWTAFSYLLNTWELEASFFVKILKVTPTVYLRFFQSGFNYFVFFNCVLGFGKKITNAVNEDKTSKSLQYTLGTCLLFFVYYVYMQDKKIFFLRDMFHLNTAMYYGSSIAKLIVIMCVLMFYIQEKNITIKMMIGVGCISIVMISKSSIVLPILVVITVASCITWLIQSSDKHKKWLGTAIGILYIVLGIVVPSDGGIQQEVYTYVKLMIESPVMWLCTVVFIISFSIKEKVIYRLNSILVISGAMIVVPQINDVFEKCSVYGFVGGRAWSMWVYTFVVLNVIYSYILLCKVCRDKIVKALYIVITCGMTVLLLYGFKTDGGELFVTDKMSATTNLRESINVILHNRKFIPNSTIELGKELEEISADSGEKLYVLSPQWSGVDGTAHSLCTQLRTVAPSVVSVSAIGRYQVDQDCELYGYDQSVYDEFNNQPSDETLEPLKEAVEKYKINCYVTQNKECGKHLKKIGFKEEKPIQEGVYYVWSKIE